MPSYSSGAHIPRKPSLPISSITSRAKCLVRSHSAAKGSIFSRANSRASSTTWSSSVAVGIEPPPRFPAQLPLGHHLLEQRRWTILLLVEPVLQHFHDRQTHVQADQVREGQRPEWMAHPELHDLVHGFRRL